MARTFATAGGTWATAGGTFGTAVVIPPPTWVAFEGEAVVSVNGMEGRLAVAGTFEGTVTLGTGVLEGA